MSDKAQKTEQATARRIDKARREGQFPAAKEFVGGLQFLAFVAMAAAWGEQWFAEVKQAARILLVQAFDTSLSSAGIAHLFIDLLWRSCARLVLAGALLVVLTLLIRVGTTKMGLSAKKLTPDIKRLSPLKKIKELPRQNLPALLQALVMLPLFGMAVYMIARDNLPTYLTLPLADEITGSRHVGASIRELLWKASGVFVVVGFVDLFRQQRRYQKDLRMSKQEIRDEMKEVEGNPQTKSRIRRLQRDLLRRHMMSQIPTATAVIVNPTHYAVAIRYEAESEGAPKVVAKGKNYLALRIRKRAVEHQVPVIENAPLAQSLYKSVEVGQEIPIHLYRAVAEILAYIYRLMNGRLPG